MAKAPKFHHTLNQAPRSAKHHGRDRQTTPAVHGRSARQSGDARAKRASPFSLAGVTWFAWDISAPEPIENAGIRAGEIIAWRGWRIVGRHLRSVYRSEHVWKPGEQMTGDVRHVYGIHAYKDEERATRYCQLYAMQEAMIESAFLYGDTSIAQWRPFAIGTVALWGEVIEHEHGYRAEFAKVHSIKRLIGHGADLDEVRAIYGVK